jgi:MFS family permease
LRYKLNGMKDQVRAYQDRLKRYDNIDGTGEMFLGLMLLGFTLAGYLEACLPDNASRWWHGIVIYGVMIPVFVIGFLARRLIKKHLTWPRTGYAAYPRTGGKSWWMGMVAVFVVALVLALGSAYLLRHARWHPAINLPRIGLLFAWPAMYALWVYCMDKHRPWKWLLVIFMALGLVALAFLAPGNFEAFFQPVSLFVGLIWLTSGGATLYSYLRHTHPAIPEAQ